MFKYLLACIRGLRLKKCKSSCMSVEVEASPPHTPIENIENKEITIYNV